MGSIEERRTNTPNSNPNSLLIGFSMASTSSSSATEEKMIRLVSSDGVEFEVKESVAIQSQIIRYMMEDDCSVDIPVPNVQGDVLSKILEFCKKHVESSSDEDIKTWEAEFMKVDQPMLYDLLVASNFLDIKKLLDLACQTVADMIRGKSPEEIRNMFNIKNDFAPEEEEALRKEYAWAFD